MSTWDDFDQGDLEDYKVDEQATEALWGRAWALEQLDGAQEGDLVLAEYVPFGGSVWGIVTGVYSAKDQTFAWKSEGVGVNVFTTTTFNTPAYEYTVVCGPKEIMGQIMPMIEDSNDE